jgi:uncharacterized surface protein with fasciclin (FAS1) repeats
MRSRTLSTLALTLSVTFGLAACGSEVQNNEAETTLAAEEATTEATTEAPTETSAPAGEAAALVDIVDTAVAAGSFTTLAKLLGDAGLVETLKGEGPFTVFAPTDEAFAKVPADVLAGLAADKAALANVLKYHVVAGKVLAADVKTGDVASVAGPAIKVVAADGKVTVNGANVTTADVMTSNGVIHIIDAVILPPA